MAIKTKLNTRNGLSFDAAVLVITALTESRSENYQYHAAPSGHNSTGGTKYQANVNDQPQRNAQFQVSIFASEELLRAGEPPAGFLYNEETGQPSHPLVLDDSSELERLEQAYELLTSKYPTAASVDVSDLGLI